MTGGWAMTYAWLSLWKGASLGAYTVCRGKFAGWPVSFRSEREKDRCSIHLYGAKCLQCRCFLSWTV